MNVWMALMLVASFGVGGNSPGAPKVERKDLHRLTGAPWTGTLTYLDYRSNRPVSIPSALIVTPVAGNRLAWVFEYRYPDEPQENSRDTVALSKDRKTLDGERVVERTRLGRDSVRIVTEKPGPDNDQPALFRFTYLIGARSFSVQKAVRPEGKPAFFERNRYAWTR